MPLKSLTFRVPPSKIFSIAIRVSRCHFVKSGVSQGICVNAGIASTDFCKRSFARAFDIAIVSTSPGCDV